MDFQGDLNLEATELRLGPPGGAGDTQRSSAVIRSNKRALLPDMNEAATFSKSDIAADDASVAGKAQHGGAPPPTKAQVVGWPPIRSYRKNCLQAKKSSGEAESAGIYVKVSMDGAPYLRKIDLRLYKGYQELLKSLQDMFKFKIGGYSEKEGYNGSEFVPTYDDKDGDNMLVGDVPWNMFITSCKRLRIMKGSEARGLGL